MVGTTSCCCAVRLISIICYSCAVRVGDGVIIDGIRIGVIPYSLVVHGTSRGP